MKKTLKLMAEYGGTILWRVDGDHGGPIDLDSLPIPVDLRQALFGWAAKYDETLDHDYPPDSGFASADDKKAFQLEGERLLVSLKSALGSDWEVIYFNDTE